MKDKETYIIIFITFFMMLLAGTLISWMIILNSEEKENVSVLKCKTDIIPFTENDTLTFNFTKSESYTVTNLTVRLHTDELDEYDARFEREHNVQVYPNNQLEYEFCYYTTQGGK